MDKIVLDSSSTLSSVPPCSSNEVAIRPGDCVEGEVEEWLENEALAGFRVWQLAGIIFCIVLAIIILLCCCIRFRIPRTKQNIEADHIRKKLTKDFRQELGKISNTDMDEMDLRKALDRVRAELSEEAFDKDVNTDHQKLNLIDSNKGIRGRIHRIFHRMVRPRYPDNSICEIE